jgi:dephospho-CoA kinase|tara:strand:- start:1581 stop:2168 length:588 start_codon:yes stop_codon:yes gene_type:complete
MIVIGVLGDIGSGKTFVSKQFNCPVFNADNEVQKIYKRSRFCYNKLKNKLPKYIKSYPIDKSEISKAILANKTNIKKIVHIVHPMVRKKMNYFLKKNGKKKLVVLDIPLLIENKLNKKKDILIYIDSKKSQIISRLKRRKNYNRKILDNLRRLQKKLVYKKKISSFIIKNNFNLLTVKNRVKFIKKKILNETNST